VLVCSNHITIEACEETNDMYAAIDAVTDKVARQMRKYKTRLMRKHRPRKEIVQHLDEHVLHPEPSEEDEHAEHAVVRTERHPVKPMYVDEAVLQLEMSHRQFLVFLNARSSRVNVLYRRKSGDFGLIEPTAN
jgi:putative sigma-54 modulation protein